MDRNEQSLRSQETFNDNPQSRSTVNTDENLSGSASTTNDNSSRTNDPTPASSTATTNYNGLGNMQSHATGNMHNPTMNQYSDQMRQLKTKSDTELVGGDTDVDTDAVLTSEATLVSPKKYKHLGETKRSNMDENPSASTSTSTTNDPSLTTPKSSKATTNDSWLGNGQSHATSNILTTPNQMRQLKIKSNSAGSCRTSFNTGRSTSDSDVVLPSAPMLVSPETRRRKQYIDTMGTTGTKGNSPTTKKTSISSAGTSAIKLLVIFLIGLMNGFIYHKNSSRIMDEISTEKAIEENEYFKVAVRRTDRNKYDFTVAICMIAKDSESYLTEWIDYHLLAMNFDNIYIYDNSDNFDLQRWYHNTRAHSHYKRVDIIHYPNAKLQDKLKTIQTDAYTDCLEKYGKNGPRHDYIAFIDYDEYIVLQQPRKHKNIHDLLAEYLHPFKDAGALALNWMYFGGANRTVYSPTPLTKRFQYRDAKPLHIIKSIVKPSNTINFHQPHGARYLPDTHIYDTSEPGSKVNCHANGAACERKNADVALIYHYRFMSSKEFLQKQCSRGSVDDINRGCSNNTITTDGVPLYLRPRPGKVFDDKAWKFLTKNVPKYKIFDTEDHKDFY